MASASVIAAVEARLPSWEGISDYPFVPENDVGDSPKQKFLTVEYPVSNENRITIGTPALFRERGGIRFVLHVLNLSGLSDATARVDTLRDLFRDQKLSGVQMFEASPAVFDKSNRNGAFYLLPFVVTYQFDILR